MGERMSHHSTKRLFWLLLITLFLMPIFLIGFPHERTISIDTLHNVSPVPDITGRFIRVIRSQRQEWVLFLPTVTAFFRSDSVVFYAKNIFHEPNQVQLSFLSDNPSDLKIRESGTRLCYSNIAEGVDLLFYLNANSNIEYDIKVENQASLENLHFRLSGCELIRSDQRLLWKTPHFTATETVLSVNQTDTGQAVPYTLVMDSPREYHYRLDTDTSKLPVIIDPEIVFSTYLGVEFPISLTSIVKDSSGAIYTCGTIELPVFKESKADVVDTTKTNIDTILLKMDPKGEKLFLTMIFGGKDGDEIPSDVQLSVNDAVYIGGTTTSNDFPVNQNAIQPSYGGFGDTFCFVINTQTEEVLFSSYWGGSKSDNLTSVAVLPNGNAVLCGSTNSKDFPVKRPSQALLQGLFDGFLSVIAIDKKQTEFSTFLGGKHLDSIDCIAVRKNGELVVSGTTQSPDFYTSGGKENDYQGGKDIFVTEFTPSFTLAGSNLFGGNQHDFPADIVCYQDKNYLIGTSLSRNFPITTGPSYAGHGTTDIFDGGDIILMVLQGTHLLKSRFYGGSDDEIGISVSLDEDQNMYITGNTRSIDIPVTHHATKRVLTDYISPEDGMDGLIAKLDENLEMTTYCSYWGGLGMDFIHDSFLFGHVLTFIGTTDSDDLLTTISSPKIEKTDALESFVSSIAIGYYPPSAPENLTIRTENGESILAWSPSLPGEAPIEEYYIEYSEYGTQGEGLIRKEQRKLDRVDQLSFPLSVIGLAEDKNYYFTVIAFDTNRQPSLHNKEVSIVRKIHSLPLIFLAEYYDNSTKPDKEKTIQYLNELNYPDLITLHYYSGLYPSNAVKSRTRFSIPCQNTGCLVNGVLSLTMQDRLEDTTRLLTAPWRKPSYAFSWQKISIPNQEANQEIRVKLHKVNPYPRQNLESTVLLTHQIADRHWEVLESSPNLWHSPQVLFGEEVRDFSFFFSDIPMIQTIQDRQDYVLVILLQDPSDGEILGITVIPLDNRLREGFR